jgi:hypothetical protein
MSKDAVTDWSTTAANNTDVGGINIAENCPAAGVNNALREIMEQIATWVAALYATAADFIAGTSSVKALTPDTITDLTLPTIVTYGATITLDMDALTSLNLKTTLTGNLTLANISNPKVGKTIRYRLTQDATGSRTITFGSYYKGPGGLPTLSTAAASIDCLYITIESSTEFSVDYGRGYTA